MDARKDTQRTRANGNSGRGDPHAREQQFHAGLLGVEKSSRSQIRPVVRKVMRPQFTPCDLALSESFDSDAMLRRKPSFPVCPVRDVANVRVAKRLGDCGVTLEVIKHFLRGQLAHERIGFRFHVRKSNLVRRGNQTRLDAADRR